MGNSIVYSQSVQVRDFLQKVNSILQDYLNETTLTRLLEEEPSGNPDYYKGLLSNLRRILVFTEEGLDACNVVLKDETFRKGAAEKTLYWVYHQIVEEFFSPRFDNWTEDSRAAYTGKNSINFTHRAPESIKNLLASLEYEFQGVREDLQYYETDYKTKMIQSNK